MKTIIAGSRTITDYDLVCQAIKESGFEISEVVSGQANGVDTLGEQWATENKIPIKKFPAKWDDLDASGAVIKINQFGKKYNAMAGFDRNLKMAKYAEALIAVTTGSSGTENMIQSAYMMGLDVFIKQICIQEKSYFESM